MKSFKEIAKLIRVRRDIVGLSQMELSKLLGYKNGQFISNVERGLCSIPHEKIKHLAKVLQIDVQTICQALTYDFTQGLINIIEDEEENNNLTIMKPWNNVLQNDGESRSNLEIS